MAVVDEVAQYAERLRSQNSQLRTEITTFPSGAFMFDVHWGDRLFVFAYSPSTGYGVDEANAGDGIGTYYRYGYQQLEPALEKLSALISEAVKE